MLSDRCPVCLFCPVCDVGVLWPNGLMDDETWHGGRSRAPATLCYRWGPSSPQRGTRNFRPMSVVAKQLDGLRCHLVRSTEVCLGPGDIVLYGDPAPPQKNQKGGITYFWPMSIVAKRLDGSRCQTHLVRRFPM